MVYTQLHLMIFTSRANPVSIKMIIFQFFGRKKKTQTDRNTQKYVNVSLCGMHLSFNSERGSWTCPLARLVKLIHHAFKLSVEQLYINPFGQRAAPRCAHEPLSSPSRSNKNLARVAWSTPETPLSLSYGEQITRIAFSAHLRSNSWRRHVINLTASCRIRFLLRSRASVKAIWMKFSALASLSLWRARNIPQQIW